MTNYKVHIMAHSAKFIKITNKLKVTSMSLTVASLATIDDSSCGHISKESPVDSFPT